MTKEIFSEPTTKTSDNNNNIMEEQCNNANTIHTASLTFDNHEDLQTRLVLLPYDNEECLGAVVASYADVEQAKIASNVITEKGNATVEVEEQPACISSSSSEKEEERNSSEQSVCGESDYSESEAEVEEEEETSSNSSRSSENCTKNETDTDESTDESSSLPPTPPTEDTKNDDSILPRDMTGYILDRIDLKDDEHKNTDWTQTEFSFILQTFRAMEYPMTLKFTAPPEENEENEEEEDTSSISTEDANTANASPNRNFDVMVQKRLSKAKDKFNIWGTVVQKRSEEFAAAAIAAHKERQQNQHQRQLTKGDGDSNEHEHEGSGNPEEDIEINIGRTSSTAGKNKESCETSVALPKETDVPSTSAEPEEAIYAIYIQHENGFVQVSSNTNMTNNNNNTRGQTKTKSNAASTEITNSSFLQVRESEDTPLPTTHRYQWQRRIEPTTNNNEDEENVQSWETISSATYSGYQPSALDVGWHVRCTIQRSTTTDAICYSDIVGPVVADKSLFNAARSSLVGGASFSGLRGQGPASGREFRIIIEIGTLKKRNRGSNKQVAERRNEALVTLFQVSGQTAENLCKHSGENDFSPSPLTGVSARSLSADSKSFELVIPKKWTAGTMIDALSVGESLQLCARNRMSRESLLLALGISNYSGEASKLTAKTVLFPAIARSEIDNCKASYFAGKSSLSSSANDSAMTTTSDSPPASSTAAPQSASCVDTTSLPGVQTEIVNRQQFIDLREELKKLRLVCAEKDKSLFDMRHKIDFSECKIQRLDQSLASARDEVSVLKGGQSRCMSALKSTEDRLQKTAAELSSLQQEHVNQASTYENNVSTRDARIQEFEKMVKSLQNEKAVFYAQIEARDGKLAQIPTLHDEIRNLKERVEHTEATEKDLAAISGKYVEAKEKLQEMSKVESSLDRSNQMLQDANGVIQTQQQLVKEYEHELELTQSKLQQTKMERNSSKQKADSLLKEMSRICKNGRGMEDVERMIVDQESMQQEISILRCQKAKALHDLELSRAAYDRLVEAQTMAGLDVDAMRALQQNVELERVVSSLTEHLNAKEMQLSTLMEVNQVLTDEIRLLTRREGDI